MRKGQPRPHRVDNEAGIPAVSTRQRRKVGQLGRAELDPSCSCSASAAPGKSELQLPGGSSPRLADPPPRPAHPAPPRRGTGWYIRAEWPGPGQSAEAARDRGFPAGPVGRSCRSQKPPALRSPPGAAPRCRGPADPQTRGRERLCPWRSPGSGRRVPAGIRFRAGDAQPRKARSGVRAGRSARERRRDAPGDPPLSRGRSRARERGLWAPQPVRSPRSPRVASAEAGASSSALGDK